MIPPRILEHDSLLIAWHEAVTVVDVIVPDIEPLPPEIYPAGTKGWFRRTSRHRGTFLPDVDDSAGVQMHANDVTVSPVHVDVLYEISPKQPAPKPVKPKTPWKDYS
ncbi:hypothetical protein [Paeniglutamicibacter terrestris]|uniref:Uncharacterized protein n=1 Tax=Paeniglutamicibacter terrestris TaxID=2723403 RepID=A0ABX1G878_9MICC|nr:hypothetical protein [Paeniglutamicibacter terrestris]NKG22223.1 hypothetical protein [Paeniglutamicibacter terrestris]